MYVYNVTLNIEADLEEQWLEWLRNNMLPEVFGTGLIKRHHLLRLLNDPENKDKTYALQLHFAQASHLQQFLGQYEPAFRQEMQQLYGERLMQFSTLLELIE